MLGGRDDGRLGRVHDEDPAPCRLADVDVVDADAGPSDHAQARRALEQLGVELRLRTDDDRVVTCDDVRERRFRVDVDVEAGAEELDAGVGDRLSDEHPRHTGAPWNAARACATPTPGSTCAPRSASPSSTAASAVATSKTS